jgi:flavin-dependent dehydrogenase
VNPEGVRLLGELGVADAVREAGPHVVERMEVHAPGGDRFVADFRGLDAERYAIGLSRYRLDETLLRHAQLQGVDVREGVQVRDVLRDGERVVGVEAKCGDGKEAIRARLVVGADGRYSVVSRVLGLDRPVPLLRQTGLVAHYRGVEGFECHGELHVGRQGYAGIAPLEDGLTNVAYVAGAETVATRGMEIERFFEESLAAMPLVKERLTGARRVGGIRGIGPMAHRTCRTAGDGFILVGDAAGFLDPFTGEGIYEALRAAQIAAPVVAAALRSRDTSAGALEPYRRARRRAFAAKRQVCWIVQAFIHSPALMDYVAPRLDRRQEVGRTLTGVLGDFRPARQALSPLFLARLLRP